MREAINKVPDGVYEAEGIVSMVAAEKDYGVIINTDTGLADETATQKKRESLSG